MRLFFKIVSVVVAVTPQLNRILSMWVDTHVHNTDHRNCTVMQMLKTPINAAWSGSHPDNSV